MNNVITILKQIFCEILICKSEDLDLDKPYVEMGIDSILAIQLSKLIKLKLGCNINSSQLFNFITINDLAKYIQNIIDKNIDSNQSQYSAQDDPIVITGIAGRFPQANNPNELWEILFSGKDVTSESDRFTSQKNKKFYGGFLDDIDLFDSNFFNISPLEAKNMDPQQRILLEVVWQSIEDAGFKLKDLNNSDCSVFCTSLPGDYKYILDVQNKFSFSGNAVSVLAGRISHFFNLKGENIYVDTACSSSLSCVNLAIQSLKSNNCSTAIVAASSIFSTSEIFELAKSSNILSENLACKPFDKEADGFLPSESTVCIVLNRLSDAIKDKQNIYAVIKGISVNHDGRTNGLISPNGDSQQKLIKHTYKKHAINTQDIEYIECHGTGTKIGDPIEVNALSSIFNDKCYIGSSKANLGHPLVASGLVNIIKIIKSFENNCIPPQINFSNLNPEIELKKLEVPHKISYWKKDKPMASISAFGFSGTNAHLVLQKYKQSYESSDIKTIDPYFFIFSAKSYNSLISILNSYITYFKKSHDNNQLKNISYTLCCRRTIFDYKVIIVSSTIDELIQYIKEYIKNGSLDSKSFEDINPDKLKVLEQFNSGQNIDFSVFYQDDVRVVSLPEYRFDRSRYWYDLSGKENYQVALGKDTLMIIKTKISELLGFSKTQLQDDAKLSSLGLDSLLALQLLEPFKQSLNNFDHNILFSNKTIFELANILDEHIGVKKNISSNLKKNKLNLQWKEYLGKSKKTVILLPPLNTIYNVWIQQIKYFNNKGYNILIPYYPGHNKDHDSKYFNLEELAIKIHDDLLNNFNLVKDVVILGWSLGGCILLELLLKFPNFVKKSVIISSAAKFDNNIFDQSQNLRKELDEYKSYFRLLYNKNLSYGADYLNSSCPLNFLTYYYNDLQSLNLLEELHLIQEKVLIIHGENDSVINNNDVQRLKAMPNAKIVTFNMGSHFIPLTLPFKFNEIVDSYINEI